MGEFEKSARNQQIALARRESRRLNPKTRRSAPRFAPGTIIPEVLPGMKLCKFFGEPALIPEREEREELVGKSNFTMRQLDTLMELAKRRSTSTVPTSDKDSGLESSGIVYRGIYIDPAGE